MTKTDVSYLIANDLRLAGDPSPAIDDFKNYMGDVWVCFRHNFFKNYPKDLKRKFRNTRHTIIYNVR